MSTPTLPLPCTAGQARAALTEAARELAQGVTVAQGLQGDNAGILDMLDMAQASVNGLLAVLPADDGKTISDDLNFKCLNSLSNADITLGTVEQETAMSARVHWDLGAAVTGVLQDVGGAVKQLASDAGDAAGKAAGNALNGLIPILLVVGVLLVLIARTGAIRVAV